MADQGKRDHWENLASTLGAAPSEEVEKPEETRAEPEPEAAMPPEQPSAEIEEPEVEVVHQGFGAGIDIPVQSVETAQEEVTSPGAVVEAEVAIAAEDSLASLPQSSINVVRPERRRRPEDWAKLANELGVEVPPEVLPSEVDEPVEEQETVDTASESSEEPPVVLTTLDAESEWNDEQQPKEAQEDRPRRRRKRRRRKPVEPAATDAETYVELEEVDLVGDLEDSLVLPEEAVEASPEGPGGVEEETSAPRYKRKRRRRRKSGEKTLEPVASEVDSGPPELEEESASASEDEEEEEELEDQHEDELSGEKGSHRAIPSWSEAVGILISANLESRSRNPDRRSGHRPRGHGRD